MSNPVGPQRWQPTRLRHPWDSSGKNTGVGCHFLLQCMKVKSESESEVVSDPQRPHGLQPTMLLCPWDFPGKSTGVGCHCLLHHKRLLYTIPCILSHGRVFATPWAVAHQAPLSMGFSRQEYWSGVPSPSPTLLLLLLLSRFSRVQLCATPETAAHQALLSLGFSRQEH